MSLKGNTEGANFAACTIIAKNYLPMARILAASWHQFHPECPMYVLVLDPYEGYFRPENEDFILISAEELDIPNLSGFLFKYSVLEASTAVKPYLLALLFERYAVRKLLYLDPDIQIFHSLNRLSEALENSTIVLTPHMTTPLPDDGLQPGIHDILKAGTYNLGFLGLRAGEVSQSLLEWWSRRVYHHCLVDFEANLFVDQRWMDFAPSLFSGVEINRDLGYNVAYWNLHERRISFQDGIVVNDEYPLYFYHFSGFNPDKPWIISKHQTRFEMGGIGDTRLMYVNYREQLLQHGWDETKDWKYGHDFFNNGVQIPASARRYYWSLGPDVTALGDPFTWLDLEIEAAPAISKHDRDTLEPGVNLVGYYESEKGVGEGARSNLRIIEATGLPYVVNNFVDAGSHNVEKFTGKLASENPYLANLLTINADQFTAFARQNPRYLEGHVNIGYWAWELPEFPEDWAPAFAHLDEVWAPSKFTRDSVSARSPIPVHVVPHALDTSIGGVIADRSEFGLDANTFVFLFMFDFHSFLERKNPLGLIKAFKHAFGARKDVVLFLKSCHGESKPQELTVLQRAAQGANVKLLDQTFSREQKDRLMMAADCYISLHRSEGFGLTMAEAMMMGKPVIATAYSGNLDFMSDDDSFLVPYRVVTINKTHGPYRAGYHWADPDLKYASELMRHVESNRESAAAVGARARSKVATLLHPNTIGASVRERLEQLGVTSKAIVAEVIR